MLACLVENPPVPVVAKAWQMLSNQFMPPSISSPTSVAVIPVYTDHIHLAVMPMRGCTLLWVGPLASALAGAVALYLEMQFVVLTVAGLVDVWANLRHLTRGARPADASSAQQD